MRVIAGTARRLRLKTVEGEDVRPTTDQIKETLFNIIRDEVPGSFFLDLFAGSGQIGLEAASRGARRAVFVESSRRAAACIEENIRTTKLTGVTELYRSDVLRALQSMEGKYTFDIIFMDPPYSRGLEKNVLRYLATSSLVREGGLIIVEALLGEDFGYLKASGQGAAMESRWEVPDGTGAFRPDEMAGPDAPDSFPGLALEKIKSYKTNEHVFIRKLSLGTV